ncbi:hypothetical protein [Phaeobacter sp. HF9A]|uniref:hypothetical protein n=1 Tax=Phaeobacter sp. HF9A TaxID=2721561 RepID=UPI0014300D1A|nr:hypothetical protein [Phaeobacter sp. HF9A]NIZ14733.1 hypothetical protein [Phaeobacter sp. HF9A]
MLTPSSPTPAPIDRDADALTLADLWSDALAEALPQQSAWLEWIFDTVEQKQRLAR